MKAFSDEASKNLPPMYSFNRMLMFILYRIKKDDKRWNKGKIHLQREKDSPERWWWDARVTALQSRAQQKAPRWWLISGKGSYVKWKINHTYHKTQGEHLDSNKKANADYWPNVNYYIAVLNGWEDE